jgi:hypothetical protein
MNATRKKTTPKKTAAKKANKELILRALSDPKFRKQLDSDPLKALGKRSLTAVQKREVEMVLAAVKGIEMQMNIMADQLLCACGVIV